MYDLIIIGGGPAGLTATVYAIRKRLNCLLDQPGPGRQGQCPHAHRRRGHLQRHQRRQTWYDASTTKSNTWISPASWRRLQRFDGMRIAFHRHHSRRQGTRGPDRHPGDRCGRRTAERARRRSLLPAGRGLLHRQLCTAVHRQTGGAGRARERLRCAAPPSWRRSCKQLYLVAPSHGELDTYLGRKLMAAEPCDSAGELGTGRRRRR